MTNMGTGTSRCPHGHLLHRSGLPLLALLEALDSSLWRIASRRTGRWTCGDDDHRDEAHGAEHVQRCPRTGPGPSVGGPSTTHHSDADLTGGGDAGLLPAVLSGRYRGSACRRWRTSERESQEERSSMDEPITALSGCFTMRPDSRRARSLPGQPCLEGDGGRR